MMLVLHWISSEDDACASSSSGSLPSLCCLRTGWAVYFGHTGRMPPACCVHPRGSCFRTYRCELGVVCGLLCGSTAMQLLVPVLPLLPLLPCRVWTFCANCQLTTPCHLLPPPHCLLNVIALVTRCHLLPPPPLCCCRRVRAASRGHASSSGWTFVLSKPRCASNRSGPRHWS